MKHKQYTYKITVGGIEGKGGGLELFWLLKNYFDTHREQSDCYDFWDLGFKLEK